MAPAANWKDELKRTMIALGLLTEEEALTGSVTINWNAGKICDLVKPVRFK